MPQTESVSRRFYLVCKKSFWSGKLYVLAGFWNQKKAADYAATQKGRIVILRQVENGGFETDWESKPK